MRRSIWNDQWYFWENQDSFALSWDVPQQAVKVDLPHDAMLIRPAAPDSPGGAAAGYRFGGSYVYVKELFAPEQWRDQTVCLRFDGIYENASVYVNGQLAGQQANGYCMFYVNLNDFLRYGENNTIRVAVQNGDMPNSRWYSGSGIYRDVYLMEGGLQSIAPEGARVYTQELSDDAVIGVKIPVRNRSHLAEHLTVVTRILDGEGILCAEEKTPLFLRGGGSETLRQRILLAAPRLWSAEDPYRYRLQITLENAEARMDSFECLFGVRSLQLDPKHGLRINGQTVKLRGGCIHHDSGLLGAATYPDAERRRVRIMKEAGFNAIRCSHNPAAPALLDACDELGLYVMDEAFDMWTRAKSANDYSRHFTDRADEDLRALARKDFNHPSVIIYSIGNEIPETATDHGAAVGRHLAEVLREEDPTRYITNAVNIIFASGDDLGPIAADLLGSGEVGGNVNTFMQAAAPKMDQVVNHPRMTRNLEAAAAGLDLVGYNYMTGRYEADAEKYPNRVVVGTETYPPEIARNWALMEKLPNVIGDFTWTGWDYLGEAGVGIPAYRWGEGGFGASFPCQLAYVGDIDLLGGRRPASFYREIVFGLRRDPYLVVQNPERYGQRPILTPWVISDAWSSWTHPGFEGKPVVVEIYTPGDRVDLFCNGEKIGSAVPEAFIARIETVYRPGRLEAVCFEGDREIGRSSLTTADSEKTTLQAAPEYGEKLIFVPVSLSDPDGALRTDLRAELSARVQGEAVLLGFGSADPKPDFNYPDGRCVTWLGRAMAILKKTAAAGTAVLEIQGDASASIPLAW